MGIKIDIVFTDREKSVYQPGEKVVGEVKVNNPSVAKVNGITIRFRGKSHNRWYDGGSKTTYDKQEHYVDNTITVWPQQGGVSSNDLHPGAYSFPFSFMLPDNAPCSFEGAVGWLRYAVYVAIDIPQSINKKQKAMLTVLPKADLNEDPVAKIIPSIDVEENTGLFSEKHILLKTSCNKGGYVPGEIVNIEMDIENKSDSDISAIKIWLEQKSCFIGSAFGYNRRFVKKSKAASLKEKVTIAGRDHQRWRGKMIVPSLPPSYLPNCSIIDLQFRLQFKINYGKFLGSAKFKLPIVIGTIPLSSSTSDFQPNPPSYLESVFGPVDALNDRDEELVGGNNYTPLYNYYQWPDK